MITPQSHAAVVGGGSGLGAAMAELLARSGALVEVLDIDGRLAEAVAGRIGVTAHARPMDVRDLAGVRETFRELVTLRGPLDLVINCAGLICQGEASAISPTDWDQTMAVNLSGTINVSLVALETMRLSSRGAIVNLSSLSALFIPPGFAPYVTSKAGVLAFSRALDIESRPYGIRVLVACPGNIRTAPMAVAHTSFLTPFISVESAARLLLKGIARRRGIIVFPLYAKVFWWLDRLSPSILQPLRTAIVRRGKKRSQTANR